jgi:hypothetical protein
MAMALPINECHAQVLFSPERFVVLDAGRGFGKTPLALLKLSLHLMQEYKTKQGQLLKHKIWYIAPTLKQARDIFWDRLKEYFEDQIKGKPNETRLEIKLQNGAEIVLKGARESDSLRGAYVTLVIFDEFAFHKPGYWSRIIKPMLGKVRPFGEAHFYSTPDGENEFYDLFQLGQDSTASNWASYQYKSLEGGFVDETEIEEDKKWMTIEDWLQKYEGEFIASANRVYYNFAKALHCLPVKHVPGVDIHWAWDFNEVPSCHSNLSHVHKGKIYTFDELCMGNTPKIVEAFIERYPVESLINPKTRRPCNIYLYGDVSGEHNTSGVSDYLMIQEMLIEAGYPAPEVRVNTANPLVKDRVNAVNVKLKNAAGDV